MKKARSASFLRLPDHFTETHFPVVDAKIETALWVRAGPSFENDRRAFPPIIRQRHENSRVAFLANRVDFVHKATSLTRSEMFSFILRLIDLSRNISVNRGISMVLQSPQHNERKNVTMLRARSANRNACVFCSAAWLMAARRSGCLSRHAMA